MAYDRGLAALADPTRRQIFERVLRAPGPVGEVATSFSVSRPAVSQHLRVLADAGLVSVRSVGARRVYSADPRGLGELRSYVDRMWSRALGEFEKAARRSARASAARPATTPSKERK
jgi:DNA-binding transcriptional ArsR family regulator